MLTSHRLYASLLYLGLFAGSCPGQEDNPQRVPTVNEQIRREAEQANLAMQFRGSSAEECRRWQEDFAARLRSLLGPHLPPKFWQKREERVVELEDHTRHELVLVADEVSPLPLHLLVPREKSLPRRPGILAIHGHGDFGHDPVAGKSDNEKVAQAIKSSNYDYGLQLVRRGYVVAVPCLTPFGRRLGSREAFGKQDPCGITFIRMQLLGKVLMAENLRDCRWALDLLAQHPAVDPQRLGCVGLSYGGRMTMLTAALEPRIRVAVISGALNVMQERIAKPYSCGAQIIPGLLQYGDVPEIASLIAPRPCLWEWGAKDGLIGPKEAENALDRISRAYRALGVEKNLEVDRFEGGHRWNGSLAYPLLERELMK